MIRLEHWQEDDGKIKRTKLEATFCSDGEERGIEIYLKDSEDGSHNSVYFPLKDLLKVLTKKFL